MYLVKTGLFGDGKYAFKHLPTDVSPIVDAYEHALLASYPRPRYMVGQYASTVAVLSMMPEFISDLLLGE